MDVVSKLLLLFDGLALSWMQRDKSYIESHYDLAVALNEHTLRMKNGAVVSAFRLGGVVSLLHDREKQKIATSIVKQLDPYFSKIGFSFQIVDWVDPEITGRRINETMRDSIDELKNMGIDDPMFDADYVRFVSSRSKWQEQFLVITTNPIALTKSDTVSNEADQPELADLQAAKEAFIKHGMKTSVYEQPLFLSANEIDLLVMHNAFAKRVLSVFSEAGILISMMTVSNFLRSQREVLWSTGSSESWEANLTGAAVVKQNQKRLMNNSRLQMGQIPTQILTSGAERVSSGLNVVEMGGRFFRTLNLTLPQNDREPKSYEALFKGISTKDAGYLVSYRLDSEPLETGDFKSNRAYAMLCSILPYSQNSEIKRCHDVIIKRHKSGDRTVFFQLSITVYGRTLESMNALYASISANASGWGGSKFSGVEMEPLDGIFSSVPAASALPKLTQVLEDAALVLYMSPLFVDCRLYEHGYLHFFTESSRPFPLEEHSSKNINFNSGAFGAPGTGKSTLLTMQNIALLAKPKTDSSLKGELPLIFNLDFGMTSFGLNETLQELISEKAKATGNRALAAKSALFMNHVMDTAAASAWNPHDLPIGRTSPTSRQKTMLAGFLQIMLFGVFKDKDGRFAFSKESMSFVSMLEVLVDQVYSFRSVGDTPHTFSSAEFSVFEHAKHAITFMEKIGVIPVGSNPDQVLKHASYYEISVKIMETAKARGDKDELRMALYYARAIRRFAFPRLSDYSELLSARTNLAQLYKDKTRPFLEGLTNAIQRYPCFNTITRIPIDMARVISIDIDAVVGDDDNRKALFGSMALLMYLIKRENSRESKDLYDSNLDEVFRPHLEHMDRLNMRLPSIMNLEESHILMSLFDQILCSYQRRNRKANWGLRSFSQNLDDPSSEYLSLCSAIFITSDMSTEDQVKILKNDLRLSDRNQETVTSGIGTDPTSIFVIIRTKSSGADEDDDQESDQNKNQNPPVATPLKLYLPASFLWASTADAVDRDFKTQAIKKYGFTTALRALSAKMKRGTVKPLLESSELRAILSRQLKPDGTPVYMGPSDFLMDYLVMDKRPDWMPSGIV